jgi:hypothetical protein
MGGDLAAAPPGKAPSFLVAAPKDPDRANITASDRQGLRMKARCGEVYDVAWGDAVKRKPDPQGKLPPVGNTVDVANA